MAEIQKIVLVTRKTRLQELKAVYNTPAQASFHVRQGLENYFGSVKKMAPKAAKARAQLAFKDYEAEEDHYVPAVERLTHELEGLGLHVHAIDRTLVPTYLFTEHDVLIALGQDGLVANCAKYAAGQPIVGVNPDPARFDGILLPFGVADASRAVSAVLADRAQLIRVTLAEAVLNNGQKLLAFNDLFIGPRQHQSARYQIRHGDQAEMQSSSGIIVSTGVGATGWLSSLFNMAEGLAKASGGRPGKRPVLHWEDRTLAFIVREPFISRTSQAGMVSGFIDEAHALELESQMSSGGVIFSDGIESDFLEFNSGAIATIRPSRQYAQLVAAG